MVAIDTNLLVHSHRRDSVHHTEAFDCIQKLSRAYTPWAICYHSLVEFYGIVTHPRIWSQASTPEEAKDQIDAWSECPNLRVLTDQKEQLNELLGLAVNGKVNGAMIHDARIASCCLSNGVNELWTVDRDFSRFPRLKTRNPLV